MNSYYKDAVKDALYPKRKGVISKRNKYLKVTPVAPMNKEEIHRLRLELQLSVALFADLLNVSPKTVEAWEAGTGNPSGSALRLMRMAQKNPDILMDGGAVIDLTALK
ncbi:MAG: helix-turn-helix domain-containing protein [Spirochaetales bacterium]|nr:helix-turn-helix domain-containing protein [Candidatus Physcosoma equi]